MKKILSIVTLFVLMVVPVIWGQDCTADDGTDGVELWGECYSIENTTYLNLYNSGLTGEIPHEISNLTNLTYLNLSHNELTGSIPPEIGNLTNLEELYLYENQLTGEIPHEISNLTNLTYLNLSHNELTGQIPLGIGNLTNLTNLSLWGNQLTGEIPFEIWEMTNLSFLFLYSNELTGQIPLGIGNLTNLTNLSLWGNQLTGEIPESICGLDLNWSISYFFNISDNQFCPPYPSCIEYSVGEQDTTNCSPMSIIEPTLPITFTLYQPFPNPFNPITTLRYDLPEDNFVMLTVYDMLGRLVTQLVNTTQEAGFKSVQWDATDSMGKPVSAGVYLYQIHAGEFVQTKKMVLLK